MVMWSENWILQLVTHYSPQILAGTIWSVGAALIWLVSFMLQDRTTIMTHIAALNEEMIDQQSSMREQTRLLQSIDRGITVLVNRGRNSAHELNSRSIIKTTQISPHTGHRPLAVPGLFYGPTRTRMDVPRVRGNHAAHAQRRPRPAQIRLRILREDECHAARKRLILQASGSAGW
jgi:hypothetical protein